MSIENDANARDRYSIIALGPDPYLHEWVYQANRNDTEVEVVFVVGGTLVRGTLIGYGEWERHNRSQITERNADVEKEEQSILRESLDNLLEIAGKLGHADAQSYGMAHLKNATIHGPTSCALVLPQNQPWGCRGVEHFGLKATD